MKEIKVFIKLKRVQVVVNFLWDVGFESVILFKGEGMGVYKELDVFFFLDFYFIDSLIVKLELVC